MGWESFVETILPVDGSSESNLGASYFDLPRDGPPPLAIGWATHWASRDALSVAISLANFGLPSSLLI